MKKKRILLGLVLSTAFIGAAIGMTSCAGGENPSASTSEPAATESYTVRFYSNGGTSVNSQTVESGQKATSPNAPTRTGSVNTYTFAGWYTDVALTNAFNFDTTITGDITLYAKWTSTLVEATKITMNGTEYATIKAAIAAVPTDSTDTYTIIIPKGNYNENGLEYNGKATIKLVGATDTKYGADVVITGHGSDMTAEKTRNLVGIQGSGNIILENLTLVSDWSRTRAESEGKSSNTQAEVLGTDTTGNTICYNCSFKSYQDTLRTAGKAWFYGCHIEGDVDFIWMEEAGSVALYENCEIVSVYDSASNGSAYITAPRMSYRAKVGKGLVIYNSTVKESEEAKTHNQTTQLARTPWSSGVYNQVAYINTTCSDIEATVWKGSSIATDYDRTIIGWKMDKATADSIGYAGNNDIVDETTVSKEFNGRRTILNRVYNTVKGKYEKDTDIIDIDAIIQANGYEVAKDDSKDLLEGETQVSAVTYLFDGSENDKVDSMCTGFEQESGKSHYRGGANSTIEIPVTGKCVVYVYGYYQGTATAKAGTQGESVMDFNTGSTSKIKECTYAVYDNTDKVVITASQMTYIKKIVVEYDSTITYVPVTDIEVTADSTNYTVGVSLNLKATVTPAATATNTDVRWTSSDETIATIDEVSGKVTFLQAGQEVTFTATARDGSGKTGSITCTAQAATWTEAEFYITKDGAKGSNEIAGEMSSNFTYGDIYNGDIASFKNLAGDTITTNRAAKMNGSGFVKFSTTKEAYVTIVMADRGKTVDAVLSVTGENGGTAELVSQTGDSKFPTLVYKLSGGDSWTIKRGGTAELNVIAYVKVEYNAVWDFRDGGTPATMADVNIQGTTGTVVSSNKNVSLAVDATVDKGKLQYNSAGYAQFNAGTIIKVPVVNVGSVITVVSFPGQSNYTVGGVNGTTDTDTYTVTADDVTRGYVEIVATSTAYLYSITLTNPR